MAEHSLQASGAIPRPTLERLPRYLNYLKARRSADGIERISSATIAGDLRLTAIQVRKDLAYISSGKPRTGHELNELIENLESVLGYGGGKEAVLVGAGHLGQALLAYGGFQNFGLRIVAAFDEDARLVGREIHGKRIHAIAQMHAVTAQMHVSIGIITVPALYAQAVCDQLVANGVKGILNFAPAHLRVPDGVIVRNEDIAASLALLANAVAEKEFADRQANLRGHEACVESPQL